METVVLEQRFKRKLVEALEARGMTQADLAAKLGVARQSVGQYCTGLRSPGLDVVEKFAKALDVDPVNLLDDQPLRISLSVD